MERADGKYVSIGQLPHSKIKNSDSASPLNLRNNMMKIHSQKNRQSGFVLNTEYMLFIIVLVFGLVVGWVSIRDSFNAELIDTANAIESSITFYYFNDPNRGVVPPDFVADELRFCDSGIVEGFDTPITYDADNKLIVAGCANAGTVVPAGTVSSTGTVTAPIAGE
jgi:hypothetical protein